MTFTPFARYRNFTVKNAKDLLALYPDVIHSMSWDEAKEILNQKNTAYKKTAYQQACQFGFEDRSTEIFRVQSYLFMLNDYGLEKYLDFWFKVYYAPNPYVKSEDTPFIIFCEFAKEVLQSPEHCCDFSDFCRRRIGEASYDILINAFKEFGKPLEHVESRESANLFKVSEEHIAELADLIKLIEDRFPIPVDYNSQKEFFDRFSVNNFKKFYGIDSIDEFVNRIDQDGIIDNKFNEINEDDRISFGRNVLYYGVPGSGKSHLVETLIKNTYSIRLVFHPEYNHSDFIGQIMPVVKGRDINYEFVPGPFTAILRYAETHPEKACSLVIEELNRGNAPAIFGELFQLLDRDDYGESRYKVYNADLAKEVYGDKNYGVRVPKNLTIFATMNTSDQNVFSLDTAFQRRWEMNYVANDFDLEDVVVNIDNSRITWKVFARIINKTFHTINKGLSSTEDKSLGAFFVRSMDMSKKRFTQKVLKYLWDDAFRFRREEVFKDDIISFEDLIGRVTHSVKEDYLEDVLNSELYSKMLEAVNEDNSAAEKADEQ